MTRQHQTDFEGVAVRTRSLSKRYGAHLALNGVELNVPAGAVYVLVGANGAGKSTAFKILMNLERPDSGRVEVFGLDSAVDGPMVRAQIGYVMESHDVAYRWMTCGRLLDHVKAYYPSWDDEYAKHLIRALEIDASRRVGGLSKGEARRLQLILALAHRPLLLLLDEPTDGLDPIFRKRVLTLLTEHLADTNTTVLLATHHIYEVESLADHIGVLQRGRLAAQMDRDELRRTVLRYRVEVPDGWEAPADLRFAGPRRTRVGREAQWTVVGDERAVTERLVLAGAQVREVLPVPLEDAALAFLEDESPQ
jgi:ABC-2 type transport system ATP-binding protein